MAVSDYFVWGGGGQKLTPQELEQRRQVEEALLSKGVDTSPVGHWTQGLARVAEAAAGSFRRGRLEKQEGELKDYQGGLRTKIADLLAGGSSAASAPVPTQSPMVPAPAPPASSATIPGPEAAAEIAATAPSNGAKSASQAAGVPEQVGNSQPMELAASLIGKGEVPDRAVIQEYLQNGGINLDPATTAWCAAYVNATLGQAGYEGTGSNMARSFLNYGEAVDAPQRGDLAVFSRGDPNGPYGHVGFFDTINPDGTIRVLGGNQGDAVSYSNYPADRLLGYRRPVPLSGSAEAVTAMGEEGQVPAQAPVQVAQSSGINPAIIEALTDPRADEGTRRLAAILVEQQQAREAATMEEQNWRARQQYEQELLAQDPLRQQQLEKGKLEIESLRNPQPKDTDEIREYNFARSQGFEGSFADFKQQMKKAGATNVTTNVGEGDKFYENLDKKNAETFATLSDSGVQARGKMVQIDRLDALLAQSPQGMEAGVKQWLGDMGIATEGLDTIQATRALLERMVPEQRPPGSGPMSDADIVMFRNSLPRLINQPGGNQTILQTMRGIAQYEMEMGQIADMVADRAVSPTEGRKMIRELRNPLEDFNKRLKEFGNQKQDAGAPPAGIDPADWEFMTPEERKLFQ